MYSICFDLSRLSEQDRLTVELLSEAFARRMNLQIFFKNSAQVSRNFIFLDQEDPYFAQNLKQVIEKKAIVVVLAYALLDLPASACLLLRPLRARAFQDTLLVYLNAYAVVTRDMPVETVAAAIPRVGFVKDLFIERLKALILQKGFAFFRHPACKIGLVVHNGELFLEKPLPSNFFENKPKITMTEWQEQPFPKQKALEQAVNADFFVAYLLFFNPVAASLLADEQLFLLKSFPSFVFNLPFQSAWSSPAIRNALLRLALRMQLKGAEPELISQKLLIQKKIPEADANRFCNILFILGYCQEVVAVKNKETSEAVQKNRLTDRIRRHLGLDRT